MKKMMLFAASFGSMLILGACTTTQSISGQNNLQILQNKNWILAQIGSQPIRYNAEKTPATLQFSADHQRLSGFDGCNRIMGAYQADQKNLNIGQVASTRMACLDNHQIDIAYQQALTQVKQYQVNHQELNLLDAQGNVVLKLVSPIQPR
ncbi:META domain-containing protein [Acinetobacter qingfengensis]|uniref:DUF306 domain-containing protein n=1 Tax=Acinetobacter qingfengensis TaxID=1262585 RepID=A0A1E7RE41_9GAMM|nr:META domain-containing protein [Acinetobacter qingfengensis]KAA8734519.1 META domain-containing protein [Acinetobacter qingfengensis]OEY97556.1 hypothetical protein BJI46_09385 [Acinetobacter qingfengensis]